MKPPLEIHDIMVTIKRDGAGLYEAVAHAEIDGASARYEYATEVSTSRTRARAIAYALTELAVMFDRGTIKLEDEEKESTT